MSHILKFFPLLINIDSEILKNHFHSQIITSASLSVDAINLRIEELLEKVQDGFTLNDIENLLCFILFIRFIILSLRYNLKTSFYITCIGLVAGYLWYKHLIDLISMYQSVLLQLPFVNKLGIDVVQLRSLNQGILATDLNLQENVNWYNPGQILYYAFKDGVRNTDAEAGLQYYIDPISMFISNLQEPIKSPSSLIYYKIYNEIIPKIFNICSKFWSQLSGVAAYAIITRIGKRYCPYLIRWHWTLLIILGMIEQIFIYFIYRAYYFQTFILIPQIKAYTNNTDSSLAFQLVILNAIIAVVVLTHISFIIFGLMNAIRGQYFYVPFLVKNTELHIGKRPVNSIYSGGATPWQDPKEKNKSTKLWYNWITRILQRVFKKLKKQFRN
jgi:hypothetical protein